MDVHRGEVVEPESAHEMLDAMTGEFACAGIRHAVRTESRNTLPMIFEVTGSTVFDPLHRKNGSHLKLAHREN